jgi:hypothetical protein
MARLPSIAFDINVLGFWPPERRGITPYRREDHEKPYGFAERREVRIFTACPPRC